MFDISGMWAAKKLIMPSRCLTPALSVGVGIPIIASTFAGSGYIQSGVTMVRYVFDLIYAQQQFVKIAVLYSSPLFFVEPGAIISHVHLHPLQ